MTRDTVPRPTPARSATWSSVGRSLEPVTASVSRPARSAVPVRPEELGVPAAAVLHPPLLRGVVDVDDAEPLAVAVGPLEVVHERPDEVALERDAVGDRLLRAGQVRGEERRPLGVVDA